MITVQNITAMKKNLHKSQRRQSQTFQNLYEFFENIDQNEIVLHQKQYLKNLLATNKQFIKDNNINNLILY